MSGIRVFDQELLESGLTGPGFVERSKTIASLPSLGLLTPAALTPDSWDVEHIEVDDLKSSGKERLLRFDLVAFSTFTARAFDAYALSGFLVVETTWVWECSRRLVGLLFLRKLGDLIGPPAFFCFLEGHPVRRSQIGFLVSLVRGIATLSFGAGEVDQLRLSR